MSEAISSLVGKGLSDKDDTEDAGTDDAPDEDEVALGYMRKFRKAMSSNDDAGMVAAFKKLMATCVPYEPEEEEGTE